ncbi:MAG: hypothetical protein GY820_43455 [Gammaproteobacteria bacterium]|nr:hypothetical protein [Gammaproteobacteria bacterium]
MLKIIEKWLESDVNFLRQYGCEFEVSRPPKATETQSITIDFDLNQYFCRLVFWDSGYAHIEVMGIESGKTFIDTSFDLTEELKAGVLFEDVFKKRIGSKLKLTF